MLVGETDHNCIMDRYFYECYKKMAEKTATYLCKHILRAIALAGVIPVNHYIFQQGKNQKLSLFSIFLLVTLCVSVLEVLLNSFLYFSRIKNKDIIMSLAIELHHTKQIDSLKNSQRDDYEELINLYEHQNSLDMKVSVSYYDFQNMEKLNDVSNEFKTIRQKTGENILRVALQADMKVFRFMQLLLKLGSAAIIIFGFVVGSISPINDAQHSLLQLTLISQVIFRPKIFTILILICLLPVIVVLMIIFLCCCKKGEKQAKLPEPMKVTTETISKCSECSICFQDYVPDENIIILPCSQNHIFHTTCIQGWTKIKPNCPICRQQLVQ